MDLIWEVKFLIVHSRDGVFSSAIEIQELLFASYYRQNGQHLLKTEACSTMSYNSSTKRGFIRLLKGLPTSTRQGFLNLTQVFSGGLTTEKSAGIRLSKTWRNHQVLCNIFWLPQNETLLLERAWWDLLYLHIWRQNASDVEEVESDDSQRKRLHHR